MAGGDAADADLLLPFCVDSIGDLCNSAARMANPEKTEGIMSGTRMFLRKPHHWGNQNRSRVQAGKLPGRITAILVSRFIPLCSAPTSKGSKCLIFHFRGDEIATCSGVKI